MGGGGEDGTTCVGCEGGTGIISLLGTGVASSMVTGGSSA